MKQKTTYSESAKLDAFLKSCTITGSYATNTINIIVNEDAPFLDQILDYTQYDLGSYLLKQSTTYYVLEHQRWFHQEYRLLLIAKYMEDGHDEEAAKEYVRGYTTEKLVHLSLSDDHNMFENATIIVEFKKNVGRISDAYDIHAGNLGKVLQLDASIMGVYKERSEVCEMNVVLSDKGMKINGLDKNEKNNVRLIRGYQYSEDHHVILSTVAEIPAQQIQIEPPLGKDVRGKAGARKEYKDCIMYGPEATQGAHLPGETVHIVGVVKSRPIKAPRSRTTEKEVYLCILAIWPEEDQNLPTLSDEDLKMLQDDSRRDGELFRRKLCKSYAPQVWGNDLAKMAIMMACIGTDDFGNTQDGDPIRGNLMVYLISEPGEAKGEMLKWIPKIRIKSIITNTPTDSPLGLMFGQNKDRTILYPGPIATHDVIALDEISKASKGFFGSFNTPIEQQILQYHKTGFDVERPHRFSLIAAGNPWLGIWDPDRTFADNIKPMPTDFASRFLCILLLNKEEHDKPKADHVDKAAFNELRNVENIYTVQQLAGWIEHCRHIKVEIPKPIRETLVREFLASVRISRVANKPLVKTRQQFNLYRIVRIMTQLMGETVVTDKIAEAAVQFFKDCQSTVGIEEGLGIQEQSHLSAKDNKVTTFVKIITSMCQVDDSVDEMSLANKMWSEEYNNYWPTQINARMWITKMVDQCIIYEPTSGKYRLMDA